jgi:GNAT superfamily N-acetyltransferase
VPASFLSTIKKAIYMSKFKVHWADTLDSHVDAALRYLPHSDLCSAEAYRRLLGTKTAEYTKIAVVSENGEPIAVSGMIQRGRLLWEPMSNWLHPGLTFPTITGRHVQALAALGVKVPLAWWRMPGDPGDGPYIRDVKLKPTYRMTNIAAREEFWRSTDYLRHIKNIRNRTRHLEIRVGGNEFTKAIVTGWHKTWLGDNEDTMAIAGRVALADVLEPAGKHVTVALLDKGKLVAGSTNFIHEGALVAGVSYLDKEYRKLGAGVRMIDTVFAVAEQKGLSMFDLGGGAEYKQKWAPESGYRAKVTIMPPHIRGLERCERAARRWFGRIAAPALAGTAKGVSMFGFLPDVESAVALRRVLPLLV